MVMVLMRFVVLKLLGGAEAVRQGDPATEPVAEPGRLCAVAGELVERACRQVDCADLRPSRCSDERVPAAGARLVLGLEAFAEQVMNLRGLLKGPPGRSRPLS